MLTFSASMVPWEKDSVKVVKITNRMAMSLFMMAELGLGWEGNNRNVTKE